MAKRLTTFSKFLITFLILAVIAFAGRYILNETEFGRNLANSSNQDDYEKKEGAKVDDSVIKIGVVTWGGYAGGQYFNEGFEANTKSRFYKDYGFKVEFKILDDFDASRAAWKSDEVNLLWATIDAFPTEAAGLRDFEPQVVFQADWSRGGDAIVVRRGITKVSDLKGKKIAVAEMTPSHSFLLWLLDAGGLEVSDVEIVAQPNAIDAAQVFKSQLVDAAVVWSPDDEDCLNSVAGSRVLESTRSASHIIADVFIAKKEYVSKNQEKLRQLYEGWMIGAAEINASDASKRKAAKILADAFDGFDENMSYNAINNVRLTTHGDNQDFFKLNPKYKGVTGESLYSKMTNVYQSLGYADKDVPNWRLVANAKLVSSTNLTGAEHASEGQKEFASATESDKTKSAIATKRVSINFRTGEYKLDENAKTIIDLEFVDIAKAFANSRIRIEGNTDNVGSSSSNKKLSLKRAQSVVDYLVAAHGMPANRFIVVGNGPDKPVASNNTAEGKAKNRRTDFELVPE
jgi:NitT/TauT family transport system substrate-binding protein